PDILLPTQSGPREADTHFLPLLHIQVYSVLQDTDRIRSRAASVTADIRWTSLHHIFHIPDLSLPSASAVRPDPFFRHISSGSSGSQGSSRQSFSRISAA